MRMENWKWLGTLVLLLASATSWPADKEAGKRTAATCFACHGPGGLSMVPMWPNLAGQKKDYLVKQLKAFVSGDRKDPAMSPVAKTLSESDIENVAEFFSEQKACK